MRTEDNYDDNQSIHSPFLGLLEDSTFSDVTFVVGVTKFQLHKCILAAKSTVFKDILKNSNGTVKLTDISAEIFREFIRFIYGGIIPDLDKFAFEMFELANKVNQLIYFIQSTFHNSEKMSVNAQGSTTTAFEECFFLFPNYGKLTVIIK